MIEAPATRAERALTDARDAVPAPGTASASVEPAADERWIPHSEAETRGLCPQRSDGFNYWQQHDPRCHMHVRWTMRWARDPDSMRTPSAGESCG
jgi:hypothetical protein